MTRFLVDAVSVFGLAGIGLGIVVGVMLGSWRLGERAQAIALVAVVFLANILIAFASDIQRVFALGGLSPTQLRSVVLMTLLGVLAGFVIKRVTR